MQAQSQQVEHLVQLMQLGIDKENQQSPNFIYHRINADLNNTMKLEMDETKPEKLKSLAQKANYQFHEHCSIIVKTYCQ
jgi:hypothetical protein